MRRNRALALWCLVDLFLLPCVASAGDLWTVGPDPGNDFDEISRAVKKAAEGDTILVRSGVYSGFAIAGKSLAIHADEGAVVSVVAPIEIGGLGAGQSVRLSGFAVSQAAAAFPGPVRVQDCAGLVWLQDLELDGALTILTGVLAIKSSPRVVVESCSLTLQSAGSGFSVAALFAEQSGVEIFQSSLVGGAGSLDGFGIGSAGTPALVLVDSQAWVDGSSLVGGAGGGGLIISPQQCVGDAGDGGAAITLSGATSQAVLHEVVLTPGAGGAMPVNPLDMCTGQPGVEGPQSVVLGGVLSSAPGAARRLFIPATVREGDVYNVVFEGEPFDVAWLALSLGGDVQFDPQVVGPLLLAPPIPLLVGVGNLGALGKKTFTVQLDDIVADPLSVYFQGLFLQPSEGFVLSSARGVLHLDASVP